MRLWRYLVGEYLLICVVSYVSLLLFFSLFEFAEFVRIVAQAKREMGLVWQMTGWNLFVLSNEVGPLALLLSITFFGANLSRRGELVAIYGAGISPLKIVAPLLLITALFAGALFAVADRLAPKGLQVVERISYYELDRKFRRENYFNVRRHWFHVGDKFVRVGNVDPENQRYGQLTILDVRDGHLQARYRADSVQALGTELLGSDVAIDRYPLGEDTRETERLPELVLPLARHFNAFLDMSSRPQRMTLGQLAQIADARRLQGYDPTAYTAELHQRVWFPATVLSLVFLAATYALRVDVKRSFVRALAELLALTVLAFVVRQLFRSLAGGGLLPPSLGAMGPFLCFAGYGAYRMGLAAGRLRAGTTAG